MSDQPATAPSRPEAPRVSVAFTFYRVHREALLLAPEERRRLAEAFVAAAAEGASRHLGLVRPYSLLGTRADADLLLWQAAPTPEGLQGFAAALRATELAPYLERPYHYLSLTRRSMYLERHAGDPGRAVVKPEGSRYLFVYPFVKTRAWYALSMEERQRMMDEHIRTGRKYPGIKINTTYSYGLDDQEFVVAFEGDSPAEFLDLVMELRASEASSYTLRDTPSFTGVAVPLQSALEMALGLPVTASAGDDPEAEAGAVPALATAGAGG
jgi:chlorite dismutase